MCDQVISRDALTVELATRHPRRFGHRVIFCPVVSLALECFGTGYLRCHEGVAITAARDQPVLARRVIRRDRPVRRDTESNLDKREWQPEPSGNDPVKNLKREGVAQARRLKNAVTSESGRAED